MFKKLVIYYFVGCAGSRYKSGITILKYIVEITLSVFVSTMLLRLGYVLFLPKSSFVWSMLAADAFLACGV
jgi:hypothetical protein